MISWTLARSKLALAIQRGDSPEQVEQLRQAYYAAKASAYLSDLIAADRLAPEHRRELAEVLIGGDRHAA